MERLGTVRQALLNTENVEKRRILLDRSVASMSKVLNNFCLRKATRMVK